MNKSVFITEVTIIDPESNAPVEVSIFKHERGGMFGIDTSFVAQVLDKDDGNNPMIHDPFETFEKGIYISNDGLELIGC